MKNEKGVTILSLMIIVTVMLIISSVGIRYGMQSYQGVQLKNFAYQLEQIQGEVDAKHEQMKIAKEDYTSYGQNITASPEAVEVLRNVKGINYSNIASTDENYYSKGQTKYRYFTKDDLKTVFDIKSPKLNVIINMETREVISVDGQEFEGKMYYTAKDI